MKSCRRGVSKRWGRWGQGIFLCLLLVFCVFSSSAFADVGPEDVLILVNQNSPASIYIGKLYRFYYPGIDSSQVLYLSGLTDCSGADSTPADEIITREQYNQYIAEPVRKYLADANYPARFTQIKVIITTAGIPYRIEDTNPNFQSDPAHPTRGVVYPAGSNATLVSQNESAIDAASVESDLTCLWYSDYDSNSFGLSNRMVNPYQGYRHSSIELFERLAPGTKQFNWTTARSWIPAVAGPLIEGTRSGSGAKDRQFNAGDMYFTARLDGPKGQGKNAIFSVIEMLERSKRASDPSIGVSPAEAVAVMDDAPDAAIGNINRNRVFNLDYGVDYWQYSEGTNQPPNATGVRVEDDFEHGYITTTQAVPQPDVLNIDTMAAAGDLCIMLDLRPQSCTSQYDLDQCVLDMPDRSEHQGLVFLSTFGRNGDEGNPSDYLLTGGPEQGPLFNTVNGAVFTSLESYNAVTMFSDIYTSQGKLIDFIEIGGAGAIGHCFEPQTDAAIDNEFLLYNLLADEDEDGFADLTFIEAAFTAIPYLSWSEVVIGDPLMRIAYGPGNQAQSYFTEHVDLGPLWEFGDTDGDGHVNAGDITPIITHYGCVFCECPAADLNLDGYINTGDVVPIINNYGLSE